MGSSCSEIPLRSTGTALSPVRRLRRQLGRFEPALKLAGEGLSELLWPTRCVLCDVPGTVLCPECRMELFYIDPLQACPRCGQAYGRLVCTDCNSFMVEHRGIDPRHIDAVASVFEFREPCKRLITTFKDKHELRLAPVLAGLLSNNLNPDWINSSTAIATIPARQAALRERGFDHMKEIAQHMAHLTDLPLLDLLAQNERIDQRGLSANMRARNMSDSFVTNYPTMEPAKRIALDLQFGQQGLPHTVVLIDDVLTTGATLTSAAAVLKEMGVTRIFGLTLARVP